jgi:Tol biopolymer transport system component
MIAGKRPFHGDTPISTLAAILTQEPEPLSKTVDHMPAELEALLGRCFCKDPANRFPYAEDLKTALEELRQQYDSGSFARRTTAHLSVPRRFHTVLWTLLFASLLVAAGIWKWPASPPNSTPLREIPITFYPGLQINPSLSQDGAEVAFAWRKVGQTAFHIFIKTTIGPDEPLPLTRDPASDLYPALSPDGAQVAFLRFLSAGSAAVMLVSKFGKSERKIADVGSIAGAQPGLAAVLIGPVLSWSPDGKYIAAPDHDQTGPLRIVLISVETGEKRRLTEPAPEDFPGDLEVSFSPNGESLAFTRFLGLGQARIFRLDLTQDLRANGAPRLIRTGIPGNHSPSWTPDGRDLLFASGWLQRSGIWRIDASGRGTARQVPTPNLSAFWPVSSGLGKRLVYASAEIETSNWELALGPAGLPVGKPTSIIRTTRKDTSLDYQPGGGRIAFLSDRRGQVEIWIADRDGSNERPLVLGAEHPTDGPKWSPDGKQILYIANPDSETHLYAIGVDGGPSRRLTSRPVYAVTPQWSSDGKWVLYTEGRSGRPEIWKMKVEGGEPIQVTKGGGFAPRTSPDGAFLYYKKSILSTEVWRLPTAGGEEERLFGTSGPVMDLAVSDKGIYCEVNPLLEEGSGSIQFFDFVSRKVEEISHTPKPVFVGLGISPDGRSLTYSQIERAETGLMRVEHFQ